MIGCLVLNTVFVEINMVKFIIIEKIWVQIATRRPTFSERLGIFRAISLKTRGVMYPNPILINITSAIRKNLALTQNPPPGNLNMARKTKISKQPIANNVGIR